MKTKVLLWISLLTLCAPNPAFSKTLFFFEGRIDLLEKRFFCTLDFPAGASRDSAASPAPKAVIFSAEKLSEKNYRLSLNIDHLRTPFFDLLSEIESSIELIAEEPRAAASILHRRPAMRGEIRSRYSLVDYKPIRELSGQFEIKDGKVSLTSFSFGNLTGQGSMDLSYPHKAEAVVFLNHVQMQDFLSFWMGGKKYESAGTVSGRITVFGPLERLVLKGSLESHEGFIEQLAYNSIYLNAGGIYPRFEVANSTISQKDGMSFTLEGAVDLRDRENFKKQIAALTFSPLISGSSSQSEWTIKRLKEKGSASTELKYLLREGAASPAHPDPSGMVGWERTMEF